MDAPTPPPAKTAGREPKPRRSYRALPAVLVVVLLAVNVGLTGRVAWWLERQERQAAQPPTLAEIVEGLAKTARVLEKAGKKEPAPVTRAEFSFDSIAVLPIAGPGTPDTPARVEADNLGPALSSLLAKDKRLRVVPFEKARQAKEKAPQQAARALGAKAALTGKVKLDTFVSTSVLIEMELIDAETGLTIWAKTTPLGLYNQAEWKQKLTEAAVAAVEQVRAHAAP